MTERRRILIVGAGNTQEQMAEWIRREIARYGQVVKAANIRRSDYSNDATQSISTFTPFLWGVAPTQVRVTFSP